jgi:hypothetical protein
MDWKRRRFLTVATVGALAGGLLGGAGQAGALTATLPGVGGVTVTTPTGPLTNPSSGSSPLPSAGSITTQTPTVTVPHVSVPSAPKVTSPSTPSHPSSTLRSHSGGTVTPLSASRPSQPAAPGLPSAPLLQPVADAIGEVSSTAGSLAGSVLSPVTGTAGSLVSGGGGLVSIGTPALAGGYISTAGGSYSGPYGPAAGGGYVADATPGGATRPALLSLLLASERAGATGGLAALYNIPFLTLRALVVGLEPCFGALDPLERRVVALRFGLLGGLPLSPSAIGRALGISGATARSVELRALARLDGASHAGCGGAAAGPAYMFDPTTVAGLLTAGLGATRTVALGEPAAFAGVGTPAHVWPSISSAGSLETALIVAMLVGSLLLLAGLALRRRPPAAPLPAIEGDRHHGTRPDRGPARRPAHPVTGSNGNGNGGVAVRRRPRTGARGR